MDKRMTCVYVAGPFRGPSHWAIWQNIMSAMALALEVWRLGAVAICPHGNTFPFQHAAMDEIWLAGDLEILRRCDAVVLTADWERSSGAREEVKFAVEHQIPVFGSLEALRDWLGQAEWRVSTEAKAVE